MAADGARHLKTVAPGSRPRPWPHQAPATGPATPAPATPDPAPATPQPATPAPATGAEVAVPPRAQLTVTQKAAVLVAHWAETSQRSGGMWAELTGDPPSLRKHVRRVKDREWLPDGHPGGFIGPAGQVHGFTIGLLLVAVGAWLQWLGHKALRFYLTVLFSGIAVLFLWIFAF